MNNLLGQYSTLGCASPDPACLGRNVNFGHGIRDCSNGACGTAVASTVIAFGSSYCSIATAAETTFPTTATPTATPTITAIAGLPPCGQTCMNNLIGQYSTLGCASPQPSCLCQNVNFGYPYLGFTSLTRSLSAFGFNSSIVADAVDNPTLFPLPTSSNASLDVFNTTVQFTTDYSFRCLDQAIAYAGITYNQFQSAWFYELERSYQPAEFDINKPICDAPITATSPYGDPSLPYFR
jgi:hypothetical protein